MIDPCGSLVTVGGANFLLGAVDVVAVDGVEIEDVDVKAGELGCFAWVDWADWLALARSASVAISEDINPTKSHFVRALHKYSTAQTRKKNMNAHQVSFH